MPIIAHDCPHCDVKHVGHKVMTEYRPASEPDQIHCFLQCNHCQFGSVGVFVIIGQRLDKRTGSISAHYNSHKEEFVLINFHPALANPSTPEHLPDTVATYYLEAVANIKTAPNSSGTMFRKSVDVALKIIAPEIKGNLVSRIDKIAKSGAITSELASWAHHIRLEGNDAAHEEEPFTSQDAADLHKFSELFMMYLFTLPGMLAARKAEQSD